MSPRRAVVALVAALALLPLSPATADDPEPVATTVTLTALVRPGNVDLTAAVAAADESVPAGTIELAENGAVVATGTLVDGSATLTRSVPWDTSRTFVATYLPLDATWAGSTSEPLVVTMGSSPSPPCRAAARTSCASTTLSYPRKVRQGRRVVFRLRLKVRYGSTPAGGRLALALVRRGVTVWRADRRADGRLLRLVSPRLRQRGRYRVVATFTPDAHTRPLLGRPGPIRVVRR